MSRKHFPNPYPDFQESIEIPELPHANLTEYLNAIVRNIEQKFKPLPQHGEDGVYLGTAGIAYMYYHLSKLPTLKDRKINYLQKAVEYIKPAILTSTKASAKDAVSFILGASGVYAVAAAVFHSLGDEVQSNNFKDKFYAIAEPCKLKNFLRCGSDELFVGRTGYIMGALWLAKETNTEIQKSDIYEISNLVVESGVDYSQRHHCQCPLMYAYYETEYFGAAHGLCSILQSLLSVPGYLDANPEHANRVWRSINYLLSTQSPDGNFPAAPDEVSSQSELLVQWCHGAGGMFYIMAKAFLVSTNQTYLKSCRNMADLIWNKGLLRKGPGICHGVAGNAYVFLIMFRLTHEPKYLYRAIQFFEFMQSDEFRNKARVPDNPYSLYEGLAGTACFVGDMTAPQLACFPFSDIF